jgi:KaiC/GvpD/RAD55 family RecA-like ATPase
MLTGIQGFDEITDGGLPRGRTTLVMGGPGCGKTVFALQALVNGAHGTKEAGVFVAFEESTRQIVANAATFGWDLPALEKKKLFFLDARLDPEVVKAGEFDLLGMLNVLRAKAEEIHAKRIVFDGIDVLLSLLDNPVAERREVYRLRDWLAQTGAAKKRTHVATELKRLQLQLAQAEAVARLQVVQTEMDARNAEIAVLAQATGSAANLLATDKAVLRTMRHADKEVHVRKGTGASGGAAKNGDGGAL